MRILMNILNKFIDEIKKNIVCKVNKVLYDAFTSCSSYYYLTHFKYSSAIAKSKNGLI